MLRTVNTELGPVQGLIGRDPRVTVFRGIPFAKPPVGDLRWRAPQPAEPWEGVRKCYEFGDMPMAPAMPGGPGGPVGPDGSDSPDGGPAPQGFDPFADMDYAMSEDCLYLNIWSPARTPEDNLPVLCFFHGGGMQNGCSYGATYDGEHLAQQGIIVVTVGYRVGLFGFLAHPELTSELRGQEPVTNFGLQDQSMALHWLSRNIRSFGGDPSRIVISGQSSGAESVQLQLCSPANPKGLIAGGICESSIQFDFGDGGSGITFVETLEASEQLGEAFFAKAGIESLAAARAMDAGTLMQRVAQVGFEMPMHQMSFAVSIDGDFVTEPLHTAYYKGHIPDVPMLVGVCKDELHQLFPPRSGGLAALEAQAVQYGPRKAEFLALAGAKTDAEADALLNGTAFNPFYAWTAAFCSLRAAAGQQVYFFLFDPDMPGSPMGSCHSAELPFVFDNLDTDWYPFEGRHYDLARQVKGYWVNFIRSGDPNGSDAKGCALPQWKPYQPGEKNFLKFADTACPGILPDAPVLDFRLDFGRSVYAPD